MTFLYVLMLFEKTIYCLICIMFWTNLQQFSEFATGKCHIIKFVNHPVLEIQTQQCHESRTRLSRKSYFIFVLQVFPQKCQMDVKIAV